MAEGNPKEEVDESRDISSRFGCPLHHCVKEITAQLHYFHAVVLPDCEGLEYFLEKWKFLRHQLYQFALKTVEQLAEGSVANNRKEGFSTGPG